MSRVLTAAGLAVTSTDLRDRGFGTPGVDFLTAPRLRVANVITNPPFKLAEAFAVRALTVATQKVALLVRLTWLESERRRALFQGTPLARVWVFSRRIVIHRAGYAVKSPSGYGGMTAYAWFVWAHGHAGPPTLGWLPTLKEDS